MGLLWGNTNNFGGNPCTFFQRLGLMKPLLNHLSVLVSANGMNGRGELTHHGSTKNSNVNSAANQKSKNCISLYLYFAGRFAILQKSITNKSIELSNPTRHRRSDLSSKRSTNFIHPNEGPVTTQILSPTTEIQQKELNAI